MERLKLGVRLKIETNDSDMSQYMALSTDSGSPDFSQMLNLRFDWEMGSILGLPWRSLPFSVRSLKSLFYQSFMVILIIVNHVCSKLFVLKTTEIGRIHIIYSWDLWPEPVSVVRAFVKYIWTPQNSRFYEGSFPQFRVNVVSEFRDTLTSRGASNCIIVNMYMDYCRLHAEFKGQIYTFVLHF